MTLSDEAIERVARAIREHHSTIVRQPSRTFGQRKTFHQGDAKAARAALEASGLVDQSERIKALEDRLATAGEALNRGLDNAEKAPRGLRTRVLNLAILTALDAIKEKNGE